MLPALAGGQPPPCPASPIEQPEQRAEYQADDDAGDQRKMERGPAALEHDIARKAPKPDP
jgi:hypothetical protein